MERAGFGSGETAVFFAFVSFCFCGCIFMEWMGLMEALGRRGVG